MSHATKRSIIIVSPKEKNQKSIWSKYVELVTPGKLAYATTKDFLEDHEGGSLAALMGEKGSPQEFLKGMVYYTNQSAPHGKPSLVSGPSLLILDEFDRLEVEVNQRQWLENLAETLQHNNQILIINARSIDMGVWNKLIESGQAEVVGADAKNFNKSPRKPYIEFRTVGGELQVYTDGVPVESWDGFLPRALAVFLAIKASKGVTREQIFKVFWPHLGIKEATNVFHVTKRKISEKLGYDLVEYSGGFYRLNTGINVFVDAVEMVKLFDEMPASDENGFWFEKVISLYRDDFFSEVEDQQLAWVDEYRLKVRKAFIEATIARADSLMEPISEQIQPDFEGAASLYKEAYYKAFYQNYELREDLARKIMIALSKSNWSDKKAQIANFYREISKHLKDIYNLKPSHQTVKTYEEVAG